MFWIGALELTPEPREFVFDSLDPQQPHAPAAAGRLYLRPGGSQAPWIAGITAFVTNPYETTVARGLAGAAIHALEMERIFPGSTPEEARRRLFGEGTVQASSPGERARDLIQSFASQAFRRPAQEDEIAPYVGLVHERLDSGATFEEALRAGYRALLVSLKFLYLPEEPGELDDFAVASRLSYLFWSTMPDAELRRLAARGELRSPTQLRAQVERMLSDPRAESFTRNFTDQWLDLKDIDFTQPDGDLFPEFDEVLKNSMLDETRTFFDEMLTKDLSVSNIIDSDFMLLNTRLAKHYGVEPPAGRGLQLVKASARRGGMLTQGSVLKVTANGTNTSPVVRGAWVTERILGKAGSAAAPPIFPRSNLMYGGPPRSGNSSRSIAMTRRVRPAMRRSIRRGLRLKTTTRPGAGVNSTR